MTVAAALDGALVITPEACAAWQRALAIRSRAGEPDWLALRDALRALGQALGYDHRVVEPHRAGPEPWRWIDSPEHLRNWELSRKVRIALDAALAA